MAEPVIRVVDVSKSFHIRKDKSLKERIVNARRSRKHAERFVALQDITFDVHPGTTLGLIGHNGSGKSTLLKTIGGILTPNTGFVERRGRLAALLELGAGFHPDLTGRENVYLNASILGLTRKQTEGYFDAIVDFSGIPDFIDTQVKFYSSGMYVRLAFAVAVHVDPEILLIDEVLAVGDEPFQRKCMERIRRFQREGRTIVLVTHGLDTLGDLCDRAIMLDHGHIVVDGRPVDAVRRFRDWAEDQAGDTPVEPDQPFVEVLGATARGADGETDAVLRPGDPLSVEVDVRALTDADDLNLVLLVVDRQDRIVYGTTSRDLGVDISGPAGDRRLCFEFPAMPLAEGEYALNVVAQPYRGTPLHRIDRAALFKVRSDVEQVGVVHLEPKLTVS